MAVLGVSLVAFQMWAGPASALSQQGHVFRESFGVSTPEGGLRQPQGLAVGEASGDVYVVDAGNDRIDRFNDAHELIEVWGWGVMNGNKEYQRCATSCRPGLAGFGAYELSGARAVAVDNSPATEGERREEAEGKQATGDPSRGDVYVEVLGKEGKGVIDKFSAQGDPLARVTHSHGEPFEGPHGIAVDPNGALWVYDEESIYPFSHEEPNKACPGAEHKREPPSCPGAGTLEPSFAAEPGFENNALYGLALDGSGGVYVGHEAAAGGEAVDVIAKQALLRAEREEPALVPVVEELDHESATGLAADESTNAADPSAGDVYVDNGDSVAVFDSAGSLVQRLIANGPLQHGTGIAVDAGRGLVYVAEAGANRIDVFALEGEGDPTIGQLSTQDVGPTSGQLDGSIDPRGAATSYIFRISPTLLPSEQQPCEAPCRQLPGAPGEMPGSYREDPVDAVVGGLQAGTTYHFALLATNTVAGEPHTVQSPEAIFTTPGGNGEATADARGWELVSPTHGAGAQALTEAGGVIQAAADGQAITYVASAPEGEAEGSRSFEVTQMLATRGPSGWTQQDIVTPNEHGTGLELGQAPEYQFFATDLALALVQPFSGGGALAEPPLSPPAEGEAGKQEKTMYLRADQPLAPAPGAGPWSEQGLYEKSRENGSEEQNAGYLALVTAADTKADAGFGGPDKLVLRDATPDLTAAVIESLVPLTEGSSTSGDNLYEWREGVLTLVSVLPGSERKPAESPSLGMEGDQVRHAISDDGKRVFWTAQGHLYMTDSVRGESIQLDTVQGGSGANSPQPVFQTASADGSRVFFTDPQRLTPDSGAGEHRPDLYVCEITESETGPSCTLSDLTATSSGEPADVQGLLPGASEDGSIVYYVANGALAAGATPGQCRAQAQPGSGCNLYVERRAEVGWLRPQLIARLSGEDAPDWHPPKLLSDLGQLSSRVSPEGRYLAFMSQEAEAITGYDNLDANPEAHGARDEEVFLYDSLTGKTVCVSCDPSGSRPRGVFDPEGAGETPEGIGLLVDRTRAWEGHWLAGSLPGWTRLSRERALYQSRYLSDSGRLYFDSPADLLPQATNATEDVYEYEPQGVPRGPHTCSSSSGGFVAAPGGCLGLISSGTSSHESAFLDASEAGGEERGHTLQEGGSDVFFVTAAKLQQQDLSAGFAVYDAHECTNALPCLPAAQGAHSECESAESCGRNAGISSFGGLDIQTADTDGNGNIVPEHGVKPFTAKKETTKEKLAAALRTCRRRYRQRKRRKVCEAHAHREYGPKHTTEKHAPSRAARRRTGSEERK